MAAREVELVGVQPPVLRIFLETIDGKADFWFGNFSHESDHKADFPA